MHICFWQSKKQFKTLHVLPFAVD